MNQIDTVAGLELFAKGGNLKALHCDGCKATIGGEAFHPPINNGDRLRKSAAALGWTYRPPDVDLCPACSGSKR